MSERKRALEMGKCLLADESFWMNLNELVSEEEQEEILKCRQNLVHNISKKEEEMKQEQEKESFCHDDDDIPPDWKRYQSLLYWK